MGMSVKFMRTFTEQFFLPNVVFALVTGVTVVFITLTREGTSVGAVSFD